MSWLHALIFLWLYATESCGFTIGKFVVIQMEQHEYGELSPFLSPLQQDFAKAHDNGTTHIVTFGTKP